MTKAYLFDWGNTLMVDFPGVLGKMCDWDIVEAVEGAEEVLAYLSQDAKLYVATGAAESNVVEIKAAFNRVGLGRYISGYFCKSNLGSEKGSPDFLQKILEKLGLKPNQVTMVGDSLEADIKPALALGLQAVWLCRKETLRRVDGFRLITSLRELCL